VEEDMLPFFESLSALYHDLHDGIRQAIDKLPQEALDWTPGPEMNSVSVLVTHLTGAERFLIGDVIMHDPSNRDREAEFRVQGINKSNLLKRVNDTELYVDSVLEKLNLADLEGERTHPRRGDQVKVAWALLHTLEHTANHLGHIELTVQLWQQKNTG
jgi:Protein of unknown function (DUF1572)